MSSIYLVQALSTRNQYFHKEIFQFGNIFKLDHYLKITFSCLSNFWGQTGTRISKSKYFLLEKLSVLVGPQVRGQWKALGWLYYNWSWFTTISYIRLAGSKLGRLSRHGGKSICFQVCWKKIMGAVAVVQWQLAGLRIARSWAQILLKYVK